MTLNWFTQAFRLKGSVALTVLPRSLLFGVFGLLVSLLHYFYPSLSLKVLGDLTTNVVFNLVLGLLLVFRTNSAYDRYWEGRKAWGQLVFNIRNLAREIKFAIAAPEPANELEKQTALRLLEAFALATKHHLRQEPVASEVFDWVPPLDSNLCQLAIAPFHLRFSRSLSSWSLNNQHSAGSMVQHIVTDATQNCLC